MHESEGGSVEDFIHCPALLFSALLPWRAWRMRFGVPGSLSVFSCSTAAEPHPFSWPAELLLISLSSPQCLIHIRHRLERIPDQRGKTTALGFDYSEKIALAEFHLNSLSGALPLCVCVGSSYLFVLCCVESFSLDTDPFLSKSCRETTKRGQGEANGWKSKWHFLKHDFVDWRSQWIVQTVFGRVCWLSNGEKDKGQAAISKERSLAREIVANTYRTVVSFLTGSLGLGN